jgi:hypothetical protein
MCLLPSWIVWCGLSETMLIKFRVQYITFFSGRRLAYGYKILIYLCFQIRTVAERWRQKSVLGKFLRRLPERNRRCCSTNKKESRAYFVLFCGSFFRYYLVKQGPQYCAWLTCCSLGRFSYLSLLHELASVDIMRSILPRKVLKSFAALIRATP